MKLKNIIGSTAAKWAACLLATVCMGGAWGDPVVTFLLRDEVGDMTIAFDSSVYTLYTQEGVERSGAAVYNYMTQTVANGDPATEPAGEPSYWYHSGKTFPVGNNTGIPFTVEQSQAYVFDGWRLSGTNVRYDFTTPVTSDITLVPHFSAVEAVFEIYTEADLLAFAREVTLGRSYRSKWGGFPRQTVKLMNNITLTSNWTPIPGNFHGIFDGNDYAISGLVINDTTNEETGFFRTSGKSGNSFVVTDLTFQNPSVTSSGSFVGVLVGQADCVTVTNVTVNNPTVLSTFTDNVGGLVGSVNNNVGDDPASASVFSGCSVNGGTISCTGSDGRMVGGLFGQGLRYLTVTNCSVSNVTINGYRKLGGLIGQANYVHFTVTDASVSGVTLNALGDTSYAKDLTMGGFVGMFANSQQSTFTGTVSDLAMTGPESIASGKNYVMGWVSGGTGGTVGAAETTMSGASMTFDVTVSGTNTRTISNDSTYAGINGTAAAPADPVVTFEMTDSVGKIVIQGLDDNVHQNVFDTWNDGVNNRPNIRIAFTQTVEPGGTATKPANTPYYDYNITQPNNGNPKTFTNADSHAYTFDGWATADGELYDFTTPVASDLVLHPRFSATGATIVIHNETELRAFAREVELGRKFREQWGEEKQTVKLANDITLTGSWTPVAGFEGIFDGDNHSISGLVISATADYAGFFSGLNSHTVVKDLTFVSPTVTSTDEYVGVLAGSASSNSSTVHPQVSNVNVTGAFSVSGENNVGALIGQVNAGVQIEDCTVTGVGATVTATGSDGRCVGGLIANTIGAVSVTDCSVSGVTVTGYRKIGGLTGQVQGNLTCDNFSVSNVTLHTNADTSYSKALTMGGFVGIFPDSYSGSTISGTVSDLTMTGPANIAEDKVYIMGLVSGGTGAALDTAVTAMTNANMTFDVTVSGTNTTTINTESSYAGINGNPSVTYVAQIIRNNEVLAQYETITAAIVAAESGDTIQLLPGTYGNVELTHIHGRFQTETYQGGIFAPNVTILGGEGVTVDGIYFNGRIIPDNWTIKNVTFSGNGTQSGFHFVNGSGVSGLTVDGCKFLGGCFLSLTGGTAVNTVVTNCLFDGVAATGSGGSSAIYIPSPDGLTVTGCTIRNGAYNAIQTFPKTGSADVIITGNTFQGVNSRIINMANATTGHTGTITISGNTFYMPGTPKSDGNYVRCGKAISIGENTYNEDPSSDNWSYYFLPSDLTVTAGTYANDVSTHVADGYKAVANGTNPETWTVVVLPTYTVTFDLNAVMAEPTQASYYGGMSPDSTVFTQINLSTAPTTRYAYTVSVADGDAVAKPYDANGLQVFPARRDGYIFDGWQLGGVDYDFTTPVTSDITLTAKWKAYTDSITIADAEEFLSYATMFSASISLSDVTATLTGDVNFTDTLKPWKPLNGFSGNLDGDGHKITGLNISATAQYVGLFDQLKFGTISNLTIESPTVTSTGSYVGALAGTSVIPLTNVNITGTISITGANNIGGLIGSAGNGATFVNCSMNGTSAASSTIAGNSASGRPIGGLIGDTTAGATLTGCSVSNVTVTGARKLGGLIGQIQTGTASGNAPVICTGASVSGVTLASTAATTFSDHLTLGGMVGIFASPYGADVFSGTVSDLTMTGPANIAEGKNYIMGLVSGGTGKTVAEAKDAMTDANMTFDVAVGGTNTRTIETESVYAGINGNPPVVYVAQIGETKYATLEAAIDDAQGGDTILLLADATLDEAAIVSKNLTITLDGHSITGTITAGSGYEIVTSDTAYVVRGAGYAGEVLPAGPDMSGDVINVTAANAQYTLDGAYGNINGKTINFTESVPYTLDLARPTKFSGSGTTGSGSMADPYSRTLNNVTFTSNSGVTLAGFYCHPGHISADNDYERYNYVNDRIVTSVNDGYYRNSVLTGITFSGLTINGTTEKSIDVIGSQENLTISGITFTGCTITNNTNGAIYFNNNGNLEYGAVSFGNCNIYGYKVGIYINGVGGAAITVTNNYIVAGSANNNAIQITKKNADGTGSVSVTGNYLKSDKYTVNLNNFGSNQIVFTGNAVVAGSRGHLGHFQGDASGNFWAPQGATPDASGNMTSTLTEPIADTGAAPGENDITSSSYYTAAVVNTSATPWVTLSNPYNVWVGGVSITEQNAADVFGDGKVSYDNATKTLTLNGYTYSGAGYENSAIYASDDISVVVQGENSLTSTAGYGIYAGGTISVTGTGVDPTLSIAAKSDSYAMQVAGASAAFTNLTMSASGNRGIVVNQNNTPADSIDVKRCNITFASGMDRAFQTWNGEGDSLLTVADSTVTGVGHILMFADGDTGDTICFITNSTVSLTASQIESYNGNATVEISESTVSMTGGSNNKNGAFNVGARYAAGTSATVKILNNSHVTCSGQFSGINVWTWGENGAMGSNIIVKDSALAGSGSYYGLSAYAMYSGDTSVYFENSTVNATGVVSAIEICSDAKYNAIGDKTYTQVNSDVTLTATSYGYGLDLDNSTKDKVNGDASNTATISGGSLTCNGCGILVTGDDDTNSSVTIHNANVAIDVSEHDWYTFATGELSIDSGSYSFTHAANRGILVDDGNITGGIFTEDVSDLCAATYLCVLNTDEATAKVYPFAVVPAVASITIDDETTYYATFQDAIDDAELSDDEITITVVNYNAETMVAPEGWKFVTENDVTTLVKKVYVAQIGTTKYESLAEAVAAAQAGDTVTLLTDVALTSMVTIDKSVKIDGNDKTITVTKGDANYYAFYFIGETAAIDCEFKNATIVSTGYQVAIMGNCDYQSTLKVDNVDITCDGECIYANGFITVNATGCEFRHDGMYVEGKDPVYYSAIIVGYSGTINLADCEIISFGNGVSTFPSGGTVTMSNVDIDVTTVVNSENSGYAMWVRNEDYTSYPEYCSDSVIIFESGSVKGNFKVTDTYTGDDPKNRYDARTTVSGGIFSTDPSAYVADGYVVLANEDVVTKDAYPYMVALGNNVTFELGESAPTGAEKPSDGAYAVGTALPLPTYASTDTTFAGWKVAGAGDAIMVLPAGMTGDITLVATWTVAQAIEIAPDSSTPSATVEIKVTDDWISNNVEKAGETATTEEIQAALEKEDANGLPAWQNYVLGQDPNASVAADAAQGAVDAMPVVSTVTPQTVDTGFKVEYRVDEVNADGTPKAGGEGALQDTPALTVDLTELTPENNVAYYKTVAGAARRLRPSRFRGRRSAAATSRSPTSSARLR